MFFNKFIYYGENQFLGIKELKEKKKKYYFTCKIVSEKAKFYFITRKNLISCFEEFPIFKKLFNEKNNLNLKLLNV